MANSPFITANKLTLILGTLQSVKGISISDASIGTAPLTVTISNKNGLLGVSAPQAVSVTGNNTTSLTLKGTLGDINTTLSTLTDTNKVGGDDNLQISAIDSVTGLTGTGIEPIHFISAPTVSLTDVLLLKGTTTNVNNLVISDPDSSKTVPVTVTISYLPNTMSLSLIPYVPYGVNFKTTSNGYFIDGPLSDVNGILTALTASPITLGVNDVKISVLDKVTQLSSDNIVHFSAATSPTVANATQGIVANQAAVLKNIVISDDSAGSTKLTVTISDTNGLLNVSPATDLSVSGANSKNLTLTGTLKVINAALATLTDTNSIYGQDNLAFTITDAGTNLTGKGIVNVGVGVIPNLLSNPSNSISIGSASPIKGLSISDVAAGASSITVVITDTNGLLNVAPASNLSALGQNTNTLNLQGTLTAINTALGTLTDNNSKNAIDNLNFTITDNGSLLSNKAVVNIVNSPSVNTTTKSLLTQSSVVQNLDGLNGNSVFKFSANMFGTPSETNFVAIKNWIGKDVISYSSMLSVVGNSGASIKGMASINKITGVATFNNTDNTLALKLSAVEKAIASVNKPAFGHVAIFADGGDTYVVITDNHSGTGIGSGDTFIKLIGASIEHIGLENGILVAL